MKSYLLLDGTKVTIEKLSTREREFLRSLEKMGKDRVSYFEIYRIALGPGSPALQGRSRVDREVVQTPLYGVARDMATRAGIMQRLILAPQYETKRVDAEAVESPLSVAQAASLIGISRIAAYKAIKEKRLPCVQVGNVFVVKRADAEKYKRSRTSGRRGKTGRRPTPTASVR